MTDKNKSASDCEMSFVNDLIRRMTLEEKIGQMRQVHIDHHGLTEELMDDLKSGRLGSIINVADLDMVNEAQRLAAEESRLGIPLLVGRDVIHGYRTIMPIPLGQAASWNPDIVREGARIAALEAAADGINWTFAPMIDISRDARWGRIAESLGEDPHLASVLGVAMLEGFQSEDMSNKGSIAACAKHFAGYGTSEAGRDYATTNIPENELRNIYLKPFKAAVESGVAAIMTSFSDLDGVPGTANEFLLRAILRGEWDFQGVVLSDFNAVAELQIHGLTSNDKESACEAINAGVEIEMAGNTYLPNIASLINEGRIDEALIDAAVANILNVKYQLGLFDQSQTVFAEFPPPADEPAIEAAKNAALESIVMLKNDNRVLPLNIETLNSVAIIGPLADDPFEQVGTWVFDGDRDLSVTPLSAIRDMCSETVEVSFVQALETSRSRDIGQLEEALTVAREADAVLLFLGEEAILSGEAHCLADIRLPGAQQELVQRIRQTGTPVIGVILAGRPIVLTEIVDDLDAILFAWHPGTMGGPALADVIFGITSPSGKLPATFPNAVGQIPIYYNHKNSGRPPSLEQVVHIDDIGVRVPQTSLGMTAFHLDAGYEPLYPFGYGLSYTAFSYSDIEVSSDEIAIGDSFWIFATLKNEGAVAATEIAQLYVRDLVGNVTRPVRELKGFQRVHLAPGESKRLSFRLHTDDLAFYDRKNRFRVEAGDFHVWIGGSSKCDLRADFRVL